MNAESSHLGLEELIAEANGEVVGDRVRTHLAACPGCRAEAGRWGAIARGVRHLVAATPSTSVPPGQAGGRSAELAAPWRRRPRVLAAGKPRRVLVAAGIVAGLAAGALTAASVTGAFGSGSGQQIQTAAYITRVKHALATHAEEGLVSYTRTVFPPGTVIEPAGVSSWEAKEPAPGALSLHSPLTADVMVMWEYQDVAADVASTATGQPVFAEQSTTTGRRETAVGVSYRGATWWRATRALKPGAQVPAPGCSQQGFPDGSSGWPAYIRQELSCGVYHQDGRQRVDGIDAVKLTTENKSGRLALWIDPATYLPVRETELPGRSAHGQQPVQTDFRWFPVTAASLAHLKVSVPASFRQVQPPPAR
jgi:hypothetical protein